MGMHDAVFRAVGSDGIAALLRLSRSDLRHGDMCLPNILADLSTGRLSGIVDWRDAGRFDHIVDVASTIWTCGYNRHSAEVPPIVLSLIG
jgi:aminoglycoside phosphotransferase